MAHPNPINPAQDYVELTCRSFYSFGDAASRISELLPAAMDTGYRALALTDTNLCGALEFARTANELGIKPITGGTLTLTDETQLTLLAQTRKGYANLSRLFTIANASDRRELRLDPARLLDHANGLAAIMGGHASDTSQFAIDGRYIKRKNLLMTYRECFGADNVYVALQRNYGELDARRNRALIALAKDTGAQIVATNNVRYHSAERYRLYCAIVAAHRNITLDEALPYIHPNSHLRLKAPQEMRHLFNDCPQALSNTLKIAESCEFNLADDLGYKLPDADVPAGYTPASYLRQLCEEAAIRRYGAITPHVNARLDEEFALIERHGIAGFLLLYREIALMAQDIAIERGLAPPETPLEERPPGRGRGSSVAMLTGYLIGISHIDPLKWNLTLERFMSEDTESLPDIDLDFPRAIRDELLIRIHNRFGPERATLVGAITTYRARGAIAAIGGALGLPKADLTQFAAIANHIGLNNPDAIRAELAASPDWMAKLNTAHWRALMDLAPDLIGAPKALAQHIGGVALSGKPLSEMVPTRESAVEGRRVMDWDKDSAQDAGFAKIDVLSLPVLDQIAEALDLVERRVGMRPDLSQIDPKDPAVYDMINEGKCVGVFLLQSPAQLKMARRLKSRNPLDLAYQVALIRPGVGLQGSGVSQFIARYRNGVDWNYDHPLEKRALARGYGVIIWQEQVVQLISDISGMSAAEADQLRRAFTRKGGERLIAECAKRFIAGAKERGVATDAAKKIFGKLNGHYMFPESHSHAFAATAYQAAWLKRYYPTEFYVSLMNNQPMGFYPLETIKQDARLRFGVKFLNSCINRSQPQSIPEDGDIRLGLRLIKHVGAALADAIIAERARHGPYIGASDFARRACPTPDALESLVMAGALDNVSPNRRTALWEAGLLPAPKRGAQIAMPASMQDSAPELADFTAFQKMRGEYESMGIYPSGHLMEFIRPNLPRDALTCAAAERAPEGKSIRVAGWPITRQHPKGRGGMVFITIEDETGDAQIFVRPEVYERCRRALNAHVIIVGGEIQRWDGEIVLNAQSAVAISAGLAMPQAHDWH